MIRKGFILSSSVTVKNYKHIVKKLGVKNRALGKNHKETYEAPLTPFLNTVKQILSNGKTTPHSFSHLYTMNLYRNTRAETTKETTPDGYLIEINVGYFVDYGQHLETFFPRRVTLKELIVWNETKKALLPVSFLMRLRTRLGKDPNVYPILAENWDGNYRSKYITEVVSKAREKWLNA